MSHIVILVVAYILTGLSHMTRHANEPEWNQPRALQSINGTVMMVLMWPVLAYYDGGKARIFSHLILLTVFWGFGEIISQAL